MYINYSLFIVINIAILSFIIVLILNGIRKGFILQALDLIGLIVAVLFGFWLSPILADQFSFIQLGSNSNLIDILSNKIINVIAWFVIVVLGVKLLTLIIRPIFIFVSRIPILGFINKVLGGVFGAIVSLVWVCIFMMILNTPLVDNGQEVIQGTVLKPLSEIAVLSSDFLKSELANSQYIKDLIDNYMQDNVVDKDVIDWLYENDFVDVVYE